MQDSTHLNELVEFVKTHGIEQVKVLAPGLYSALATTAFQHRTAVTSLLDSAEVQRQRTLQIAGEIRAAG